MKYASRYRLLNEFMPRLLATPGVVPILVEQQVGGRPFQVTERDNRNHVQVRARSESVVWVKEALINIGMRHLLGQYPEARFLAWIDADITFLHPTWSQETVDALDIYKIVQPWSHAVDLNAKHMPVSTAE